MPNIFYINNINHLNTSTHKKKADVKYQTSEDLTIFTYTV